MAEGCNKYLESPEIGLKPSRNCNDERGDSKEMRSAHTVLAGNLKGRDCIEELGLTGKINLKNFGFLKIREIYLRSWKTISFLISRTGSGTEIVSLS
jgi:hypothetical protein